MEKQSPILMRIFKEESELEVWKQDETGRFALLRTYPICRWSGELGPKIKAGDRQAPEGFYTIIPGLMNPNSSRYLAINTGFRNAYD
jgi:murein L,D-transpeptidase YafK